MPSSPVEIALTAPDVERADGAPDAEASGGPVVVVEAPGSAAPVLPYGEGLSRLLRLVARQVPPDEVEEIWAFPGVRREGREYGVAVVSRHAADDRRRVYRARYTLDLKGDRRGTATLELEELAESPADMLPRVLAGVARRADDAGDAELMDLEAWKAQARDGADG